MSRTRRVLVVVAAWVAPAAWIAVSLGAGPSDGTVISSSVLAGAARWADAVRVVDTVGDTPLETGDLIETIDGTPLGTWAAGELDTQRRVGDTVTYEVTRPAPNLDRGLTIEVTLTRYPFVDALLRNAAPATGTILSLLAASLVFWRRPTYLPARAFLLAAALSAAALTSSPWGLGAIDLAGGRGVWPHLVGQLLATAGVGAALVGALSFPSPPPGARSRPWLVPLAALLPFAGYLVWALGPARGFGHEATRLQALITVLEPAAYVAVPVGVAMIAWAYWRSEDRAEAVAARLVLTAVLGSLGARALLGDLPQWLTGRPLLPWDVLILLLTAAVLACLVVALLGYRLDEVEPVVRRSVVQAFVAALVATAFVAVAATVGTASNIDLESLLAGGVVALLVLPLALAMQRGMRRILYGERAYRDRIVSELRRLDPTSLPEQALTDTLSVLARRLRLSYAAVRVEPPDDSEPLVASIGNPRGEPVAVDLVAGGTRLGTLHLDVDPHRDAFGPGDRRLLEDVGSQVGALVQSVLAGRALQRSRQHLVSAREDERRRLRRDLHDGLGPSLATLALRLEAAQDLISRDPPAATRLLEQLAEHVRAEIAEVRRLVDGLRPPALDQLGLVSALRQRAEEQRVPNGDRMTWTVQAADDVEPLPAAVEVAAYRIALEAVTNALRHSGAASCSVALSREDGALQLRIRDDGTGVAQDAPSGVGLTSMRERAEELGGTCTVTSDVTGTLVDVRLPLPRVGGD